MARHSLPALVLAALAASLAHGETIVVDGQVSVAPSSVERPSRGVTMSGVESRFGAPANRHATVGQPPITRWDYAGFSVFFEHDRVIHSVATSP